MTKIFITEKFQKGDYIINRYAGDMAVYDKTDKKGYMHFKLYYGGMFGDVKDKDFTLIWKYQDNYELCDEKEKECLDTIIKDYKKNPSKYDLTLFEKD